VGFEKLKALQSIFPHGDYYGQAAGVAMEDEVSGKLTICLNIVEYSPTALRGLFNSRCPLIANDENMRQVLIRKSAQNGLAFDESAQMRTGHHVPGDSVFVKTLLDCYETYSGRKGECLSTGGGTYVHRLQNGVAFGGVYPETNNNMHGADEFMVIDELLQSAKIYALAIARLCGTGNADAIGA
jgi:succinyl-diaminopimelate desuccinylase